MISRVAESCFWFHRYLERAECTARLLRVNRSYQLDVNLPEGERWKPVVVVTGEEQRFPELFPESSINDAEVVQDYLTWDERSAVGIVSSMLGARENARTIREVISQDAWECMNSQWHWLRGGQGRKLYGRDRDAFYQRIKAMVAMIEGVCESTILHEQAFDFMRMGMLLERAAQTARLLDVKHHLMEPIEGDSRRAPLESAHCMAILRSCSAEQAFLKRGSGVLTGPAVATFVVLDDKFPRSVAHALGRAWNCLQRIREATDHKMGEHSERLLGELVAHVSTTLVGDLWGDGLHRELTHIIDSAAEACIMIHEEYFDPSFEAPKSVQMQSLADPVES